MPDKLLLAADFDVCPDEPLPVWIVFHYHTFLPQVFSRALLAQQRKDASKAYPRGPQNVSPPYVSDSGSSASGQLSGSTVRRWAAGLALPSHPICSM